MRVATGTAVFEQFGERARGMVPGLEFAVMAADGTWSAPPEACDLVMLAGNAYVPAFIDQAMAMPELRWAHTEDAGTDGRFYDTMRERGITVTHSPGANAPEVAELAMSFVLWSAKRHEEFRIAQRAHRWEKLDLVPLSDKTMLVLGLGRIGAHIVRFARAFGMRVNGIRRTPEPVEGVAEHGTLADLPAMLPQADFVVCALPHSAETVGLLGADSFARMKPTSVLVNVGRGTVVDIAALRAALASGELAQACLDVFPTEPVPADDELWDVPNLFMTPHNGSRSPLYLQRVGEMWLDNLRRHANGETLRHLAP